MFLLIPFIHSECNTFTYDVNYGIVETINFNSVEKTFCETINFKYTERKAPHMFIRWEFPNGNGNHTIERQNLPQKVSNIEDITTSVDFSNGDSYKTSTIKLDLSEDGNIKFTIIAFDSEPGQQTSIISFWPSDYITIGQGSTYDFEWKENHTYNFASLTHYYGDFKVSSYNNLKVDGKYSCVYSNSKGNGTFQKELYLYSAKTVAVSLSNLSSNYVSLEFIGGINSESARLIMYPDSTDVDKSTPVLPKKATPSQSPTPKRNSAPIGPLGATFLAYVFTVIVFLIINTCICCVYPNRLYRAGCKLSCFFCCCSRGTHSSFTHFYDEHRYHKCCHCDCCDNGCCSNCNSNDCNCVCGSGFDDVLGCLVALAIVLIFGFIICLPFIMIYIFIHLIISCGKEEREFEKSGFKYESEKKDMPKNIQSSSQVPPPPPNYYVAQQYQGAPQDQQQPYYYVPQQQQYPQQNYNYQPPPYNGPPSQQPPAMQDQQPYPYNGPPSQPAPYNGTPSQPPPAMQDQQPYPYPQYQTPYQQPPPPLNNSESKDV